MQTNCTQLHLVTLLAIMIGLITIGAQSVLYLKRPHKKERLWYLGLLILLLIFNTANGLFPDPRYQISLQAQHIIVNGIGLTIVSCFPCYFYRTFGLTELRFHAIYGVPLFLVLPFWVFFVIGYLIHGDIGLAQKYGYIVPTGYLIALMVAIGRAIHDRYYSEKPKGHWNIEIVSIYVAIVPWVFMGPALYFQWGQLAETLFANMGFIAISFLMLYRAIRRSHAEYRQLNDLRMIAMDTDIITQNCERYALSPRETEIAILLCQRLSRQEIADRLFISERTVDTHTQNIFVKANVTNRKELISVFNSV